MMLGHDAVKPYAEGIQVAIGDITSERAYRIGPWINCLPDGVAAGERAEIRFDVPSPLGTFFVVSVSPVTVGGGRLRIQAYTHRNPGHRLIPGA